MKRRTYNYSESKILKTIGDRLAKERIKQKLSWFELSRRADVHQATIKKIEEGTTNPSLVVLELLTRELQIHILI